MATKKTETKTNVLEREYTIPLRKKVKVVPRYRKTNKAIKTIKEFLAKHMKVEDRDLRNVRISKYLNEYMWSRGIKNPPRKVKVKVTKDSEGIVRVELAEMPENLKFKKLREEKIDKKAEKLKPKKEEKAEEKPKDAETVKEEEQKKEENKELEKTSASAEQDLQKEMAKEKKQMAKFEKNPAQKAKEHSKGEYKH